MNISPLPVLQGIDALRRDNPWPEFDWGCVDPFYLSLDDGGRELVTRHLVQGRSVLMVEIGCFLCGSTRQWLTASPDTTVIGIDPWDGNWGPYIRDMASNNDMKRVLGKIGDVDQLVADLLKFGNYTVALNNVRAFAGRFIPIRGRSPDCLEYLKKRGMEPDLIYIDAFKEERDLEAAYRLFPYALICGDDWNWRNAGGVLQMQEHVRSFARRHGMSIEAEGATWLLGK